MTDPTGFSPLVPGFEFMQSLVKSAGAAMPGMGQWVTPTIDPEEIAKRIQELRTVQFWLEQNARMLGATIQAMEVQRMTLSTLKTMNVQMGDLREAMKIRVPDVPSPPTAAAAASKPYAPSAGEPAATAAPGVVDPMQWWGALTRQFTELAATAMKEGSSEATRAAGLAGSGASAESSAPAAAGPADAASAGRAGKPAAAKKPAGDR